MDSSETIRTPAKHQVKRLLVRGLPLVAFAAICALCAVLWQYENRSTSLVGEVGVVEHLVSSPQNGRVVQLVPSEGQELGVFSFVTKDQLLIELDDSELRRQLDATQQNLLALASEINDEIGRSQAEEQVVQDVAVTTVREDATTSSEATEIWEAAFSIVRESQKHLGVIQKELDLRQMDFGLARMKSEVAGNGVTTPQMLASAQEQRAKLVSSIAEARSELTFEREEAFQQLPSDELAASSRLLFRSIENRLTAAELEMQSAGELLARLNVAAPVDGQVERTMVSPHQAVLAGEPLITIIPSRGTYVTAHVPEQSLLRPYAGMPVTLLPRANSNQRVDAVVASVGPRIIELPERHRRNPKQVEWGRPMRIQIPDDWILEPGSLVDVWVEQH